MAVQLKWYGGKIARDVDRKARIAIKEASSELAVDVQKVIVEKAGWFSTGIRRPSERIRAIGTYRSKPGEPPRFQTGTLFRSINYELLNSWMRYHSMVGPDETAVDEYGTYYATFLELGTHIMGKRPFMHPTLRKNKKKLTKMIAERLKEAF